LEVDTLPRTVHDTVFTITPRTLFTGKLATGKLLISGVKGPVHGNTQEALVNMGEKLAGVVATRCVNICKSMEFST
jgi:hypothetical protein